MKPPDNPENGLEMATTFTKFPELPYELRREIWELTFGSRLIRLHCETINAKDRKAPAPVCLLQYKTPEARWDSNKSAPNFSAYLTVGNNKPEVVSALSVCSESRDIALSGNYRPWKMRNLEGKVLIVMWNPQVDIIDFIDKMASTSDYTGPAPNALALFEKQFPGEIKEVRYVALSTSHWEWENNQHKSVDGVWPLIDFTSLRELAVVVDRAHERSCVDTLARSNTRSVPILPWEIPQDLEQNLDTLRAHYERFGPEYHPLGKKPTVRIAKDRLEVLNGGERHIMLRCSPCENLRAS